jgi:hypothetical protein
MPEVKNIKYYYETERQHRGRTIYLPSTSTQAELVDAVTKLLSPMNRVMMIYHIVEGTVDKFVIDYEWKKQS